MPPKALVPPATRVSPSLPSQSGVTSDPPHPLPSHPGERSPPPNTQVLSQAESLPDLMDFKSDKKRARTPSSSPPSSHKGVLTLNRFDVLSSSEAEMTESQPVKIGRVEVEIHHPPPRQVVKISNTESHPPKSVNKKGNGNPRPTIARPTALPKKSSKSKAKVKF